MKEIKKTPNMIIRQQHKKTIRDDNPNKPKTLFLINQKRKLSRNDGLDIQKQMIKAENITELQQQTILKEVNKTVGKKVKMTESKLQKDMIQFLQTECHRLGQQLQKQRYDSMRNKGQIQKLRKNIAFLNEKLEKTYQDNEDLNKNNNYEVMEKQQLKQQLNKCRVIMSKKDHQYQYLQSMKNKEIQNLKRELESQKSFISKQTNQLSKLVEKNQELQEQLQQKKLEAKFLRDNFEDKKKQWDKFRMDFETQAKAHIEKKGQKISRYQGDLQTLNDRLKEEELIRKKLSEKNKQYQKEVQRNSANRHELEEQIITLKKRVNDLSILKSSNNTIMNEKIMKLTEQNDTLRREIQKIGKCKKNLLEQEKPILFGNEEMY